MNALGIHGAVWGTTWSEEDCRRAFAHSRDCGFDFIELSLANIAAYDPLLVRDLLMEYELGVLTGIGLFPETDIASDDSEIVRRGEESLMAALDCAQAMGSTFLGGIVHGALARPMRVPDSRALHQVAAVLQRVADAAATRGISLGLEVVNRYESNIVNTCDQALELVHIIDRDNVGVHADTYHMNIEESDPGEALHKCSERLQYVHIGESHRGHLGTGTIDLPSTFRSLKEIGYRGPICVESFSSSALPQEVAVRLAVWRPMWEDRLEFAGHAYRFMRDLLVE